MPCGSPAAPGKAVLSIANPEMRARPPHPALTIPAPLPPHKKHPTLLSPSADAWAVLAAAASAAGVGVDAVGASAVHIEAAAAMPASTSAHPHPSLNLPRLVPKPEWSRTLRHYTRSSEAHKSGRTSRKQKKHERERQQPSSHLRGLRHRRSRGTRSLVHSFLRDEVVEQGETNDVASDACRQASSA